VAARALSLRFRRVKLTAASLPTALLAGLGAVVLLAAAILPVRPARAATTTDQEVAEALTCQCGCGLTVANCNHPNCEFSVPTRHKIEAMLGRGMGRAEIIAYFRKQYGEKILSAPTTQGFNLLAWTMPFVALLLGAVLVVVVMGRWRSAPPSASIPPPSKDPDDVQFSPAMRARLERELRERI
jgi:cytochrome c-type biogenesis protein CcmH